VSYVNSARLSGSTLSASNDATSGIVINGGFRFQPRHFRQ
jgi:hypothetical protein